MENGKAREPTCLHRKMDFYKNSITILHDKGIEFLVGGAYALQYLTGVSRDTKDLDLFIRPVDRSRALKLLEAEGIETSVTFSHWLAKAKCGGHLVDIIFNSGNAISEVDDKWFEFALEGRLFGDSVKFTPPEEMIWSKAFIMERERFDGADISHLLLACAKTLDWTRLLDRFGSHWRVLLAHLTVFGFIYPSERGLLPNWVMRDLLERMGNELEEEPLLGRICRGTLLSRAQYKIDIEKWGFLDARLVPNGNMTRRQIKKWDEGVKIDGALHKDF